MIKYIYSVRNMFDRFKLFNSAFGPELFSFSHYVTFYTLGIPCWYI